MTHSRRDFLGLLGLGLGALVDPVFAPAVAVVTGVVMLLVLSYSSWSVRAAA